jgi:hypothetical protein
LLLNGDEAPAGNLMIEADRDLALSGKELREMCRREILPM